MALVRVLRTSAATLTHTFYVDETPTDTSAPPTMSVARLDGTVVATGTASHGATGVYTWVLPGGPAAPASATWQLDTLIVSWTGTLGGALITVTDDVEVCGGFYFGLAEARASDTSLADPVKYTTAMLAQKRIQVEQEAEKIMRRAWVPRFARHLLDGTGTADLRTYDQDLRVLRAVSLSWVTGQPLTPLAGQPLTGIVVKPDGVLTRPAGIPWPRGVGNVLVEYEYGPDSPPEEVRQAGMTRLRSRLNVNRSTIPDRVSSYTTSDGVTANTFRLTQPGKWSTGIPEVDAVYQRWEAAPGGFA